jgi:hypothetical protein
MVLAAGMFCAFGFWLGLAVAVDALAAAELMERRKQAFEAALGDILLPALYLFCGVVLVFAFNHAIAGIRFAGTFDAVFYHLDRLLFHASVSNIAHWSLSHLPSQFFALLELAYYSLYSQIGGAIFLTALLGSRWYAMKYVRTLLIGYLIALLVFLVFPTVGPFSICPFHLSSYPRSLATFWTQEAILAKARMLWAHRLTSDVVPVNIVDYYIGFPCMHVALPSIAIWFLRPWKRIALFLVVFDGMLLVPSIILLEWHYLVDLPAGFAVAFLAIRLTERISKARDSV